MAHVVEQVLLNARHTVLDGFAAFSHVHFLSMLRKIGRAHVYSSHQIISYAVFCLKKKNRSSSRIAAISASLNFRIGLVCCARSLSQFNAYRWVESALVVISRCRDLAKSCPCPI